MANDLIVDEFGINFVMGVSFDMSSNTSLEFKFLKPDQETYLTKVGVLGATELVTSVGTFAANTWAYYTFVDGDLDQDGTWKAELKYNDADPTQLYSTIAEFEVNANLSG